MSNGSYIDNALLLALAPEDATRLIEMMGKVLPGPGIVTIRSAAREIVLVGLVFGGDLLSWIMAPARCDEDAQAIEQQLKPFFARVADGLGHLVTQDAIDRAKRSH